MEIGKLTDAKRYAEEGAKVVLADIVEAGMDSALSLKGFGHDVEFSVVRL